MNGAWALLVDRADLHRTRIAGSRVPEPGADEVLLRVERFGVSANNVTYALLGDTFGYWELFPAASGWGQIPVWGYLRAVASRNPAVPEGRRAFGLCPMATHLLMRPGRITEAGFREASPHRGVLPAAYGTYFWAGGDQNRQEDLLTVLRPVFWLSFTLGQHLAEQEPGVTAVVITSASSKAAAGLAHLLGQRGVPAIGLTSEPHAGFTRGTGLYRHVVAYDQIGAGQTGALAELGGARPVLVDVAGRPTLRQEAARQLAGPVLVAGRTHSDAPDDGTRLFSAPQQIAELARRCCWPSLGRRFTAALGAFAASASWLTIGVSHGIDGASRTYQQVLGNESVPDVAHVVDVTGAG